MNQYFATANLSNIFISVYLFQNIDVPKSNFIFKKENEKELHNNYILSNKMTKNHKNKILHQQINSHIFKNYHILQGVQNGLKVIFKKKQSFLDW